MPRYTRRGVAAAAASGFVLSSFGRAHGFGSGAMQNVRHSIESSEELDPEDPKVHLDSDQLGKRRMEKVHGGNGAIDVKFISYQAARPHVMLIYELPPGASEGVHTHHLNNSEEGPFDEHYHILEGRGQMLIRDTKIPVGPGDIVHTPLGLPHGIENDARTGLLRVALTAIYRE